LRELAEATGVAVRWQNFRGEEREVEPDHLVAVLHALGVPADSPSDIADGLAQHQGVAAGLPSLLTVRQGETLRLPQAWELSLEDGSGAHGDGELRVDLPGYHHLRTGGQETTLAVCPERCHPVPPGRPWGIAVQLYGLRRAGDGGIGDFPALGDFCEAAAAQGADAVAISPVHAQFSADPHRFSPYAPSSRIMLNVLHAPAPAADPRLEQAPLVDWVEAARTRLALFRQRFEAGIDEAELARFRTERGPAVEQHARFEALHAHFFGRDPGLWSWRRWPEEYRDPHSPAVAAFARLNDREVAFHAWLQMLADQGIADAQRRARAAGMRIGLISDLAVGTDSGGSHAWSRQDEMMNGLSVGAPPDLLNTHGQSWGISAFSPLGLRRHGFAAFIEMLRSALRHAGGVRIDHAMGLQRLWVVPDGASADQGAYLRFPVDDMLRLVALESQRHRAVVLGEDLGTLPDGFHERLMGTGLLGMRVLWFERRDSWLRPPREWSHQAVAMTSTHDLATVTGWWRGRDIEWREKLNISDDARQERRERGEDRHLFWAAMRDSGAAAGEMPPADDTWPVARAAISHVGRSACELALLPIEDVLALDEQPNMPGTTDDKGHPNWRRRLPGQAGNLLDAPEIRDRLSELKAVRGG
jgi:4-alpha-glucanotransferase